MEKGEGISWLARAFCVSDMSVRLLNLRVAAAIARV